MKENGIAEKVPERHAPLLDDKPMIELSTFNADQEPKERESSIASKKSKGRSSTRLGRLSSRASTMGPGGEEEFEERACGLLPEFFFSFNLVLYILLVFMILLSSINFSYLTLPYIVLSVLICLLANIPEKSVLYNISYGVRLFSFPAIFLYSAAALIFKLVMIVKAKDEDPFIEENEDKLRSLGVTYLLKDTKTTFNLICTIGQDGVIFFYSLIFSVIGLFSEILCSNESPISFDIESSYLKVSNIQLRRHIELSYIFLILFSYFCPSFFSLSNLVTIQICMGLMAFKQNEIFKVKYYLTKTLIKLMHLSFSAFLIATNVLHISSFQIEYLVNEEEKAISDKYTCTDAPKNFWTKVGINCTYDLEQTDKIYLFIKFSTAALCYLSLENLVRLISNSSLSPDEIDQLSREEYLKKEYVDEAEEISWLVRKLKNFLTFVLYHFENDQIIPHVCRILAIIHIYYCHNVYSLAIFIWLFFSFVCSDLQSTRFICIIFLIPVMIMSSLCFVLSILIFDDADNQKKDFYTFLGLKRIGEHYYFYYVYCHLIFLIMVTFLYSMKVQKNNSNNNASIRRTATKAKGPIGDNKLTIINRNTTEESAEEANFVSKLKNFIHLDLFSTDKGKENVQKTKGLTLFNLLIKYILDNINKINLIVVYLVSVSSINVVHLLLVLLFLINVVTFINTSNKNNNGDSIAHLVVNKITLIFVQLSFIFEFGIDLIKFFYFETKTKEEQKEITEILKFLVNYNEDIDGSSSEILLYIITYCYYFQYQIFLVKTTDTSHTELKNLLSNNSIGLYFYVKENLGFFFYIYDGLMQLVQQIYIWILISTFIFFFCYFELNVLFSIKLGLFLIVVYLYLRVILKTINNTEGGGYGSMNIVMIWIFLVFCIINTIGVYLYQFICHDYFYNKIKDTFLNNESLSYFGLKKYTGDLHIKLLPHFAVNFLAILFLDEMESYKRIKEGEIQKNKEKNKEISDDSKIIEEEKKNILKEEEEKKDKSAPSEDTKEKNYSLLFEECRNRIVVLKLNLIGINLVLFFTKIYWMFLFLLICILFNSYYFSLSMVLYILIFGATFICLFRDEIKNINKYHGKNDYQAEVQERLNIIKYYREMSFKILVGYSFILFLFYYIYGIFDISVSYCNPTLWIGCNNDYNFNNTIPEDDTVAINRSELIKSYSYIFGIYFNSQKEGILSAAWVHLFFCFLFCFDVYIQQIENIFMGLKMKTIVEHDEKTLESFGLRQKSLETQVDLLIPKKEEKVSNENNNFYVRCSLRKQTSTKLIENLAATIKIYNLYKIKRKRDKEIFSIMTSIKCVFEELIIFLLITGGIMKLGIWTIIYLVIAIFFIFTEKTINKFFKFYIFNILSLILQTVLFVSNIQESTSPKGNENRDMYELLEKKLGLPWFKNRVNFLMSYFLGIGVDRAQIKTIWFEFILSIILYIYLDFFTDSKFYESAQEVSYIPFRKKNILFEALYEDPSVNNRDIMISKKDFSDIKKIMKKNTFMEDINLIRYDDLQNVLERLKKRKDNNTKMMTKEEDNIEKKKLLIKLNQKTQQIFSVLEFIKSIIYLSSHNFSLVGSTIIFMMVPGFISLVYILFCVYFLNHSNLFIQGRKYYYPHFTKIFRIILLTDISIQLIIQFIQMNDESADFLSTIGLFKLIHYTDNSVSIRDTELYIVISKALCFFFISLQVLIYNSNDFYQYYFIYLITLKLDFIKISKLNAFKFNNERIEVMSTSLQLKEDAYKTMTEVQGFLIDWQKIFDSQKNDNNSKNSKNNSKKSSSNKLINSIEGKEGKENKEYVDEEEAKNTIKGWIMDKFLIKIYLYIHKYCSPYQSIGNNEMNEYEKDIIQGRTKPYTYIEFLIDIYLDAFSPFKLTEQGLLIVESILDGSRAKRKIELDKIKKGKEKDISDLYSKNEEMKKKAEQLILTLNDIDKKVEKLEQEIKQEANNFETNEHIDTKEDGNDSDDDHSEENDEDPLGINDSCPSSPVNKRKKASVRKEEEISLGSKTNEFLVNQIETIDEDDLEGDMKVVKENMISNYKKAKKIIEEEGKKLEKQIKKYEELCKREEKHNQNKYLDDENNNEDTKEKKEINKIDLSDIKYQKFEILQTKTLLFTRYLTNKFIFSCILLDLKSCLSYNFHWFTYTIMIINHMVNPCLTTFYFPLSIFLYALLEYPRPKKIYWKVCLYYTFYLLLLKLIFSSKIFITIFNEEDFKDFLDTLKAYKIGFQYCDSTFSREYFSYIIFDMLTIVFVMININLLSINGIWDEREQEIESVYSAMERVSISQGINIKDDQIKDFNNEFFEIEDSDEKKRKKKDGKRKEDEMSSTRSTNRRKGREGRASIVDSIKARQKIMKARREQSVKIAQKEQTEKVSQSKEAKNTYFENLLPRNRNEKPGNEFYPIYTAAMIVILAYILIFFNYMIRDEIYGEVSMDVQQFNGLMVIYFIIHAIILFCDRAIVLLQNRNDNKYKYYLYSHEDINDLKKIQEFRKKTKEEKKEYFKNNAFKVEDELIQIYPKKKRWQNHSLVIPIQHFSKLKDQYTISYKQIEEFNKPLFYKYLLHVVITLFVHVITFIYFPFRGNTNLGKELFCQDDEKCNDFTENPSLIAFYIIYLFYLIPSALQIQYGFLDMKKQSLLRRGHTEMNNVIVEIIEKIPFLNEIKHIFDWTLTSTSLDLSQWIQFEAIYDAIYNTYCDDKTILGQKIERIEKIQKGGTLSFILIAALIGPLVIFSSLNPTNVINSLTSAKLKVDLSFTYKNNEIKKYTLFENSRHDLINQMSDETFAEFNYTKSVKTRNFPQEQIQNVQFYETSDTNWDLVLPHIETIINDLTISDSNNKVQAINLVIQVEFTRPLPAEAQTVSDEIIKTIYTRKDDPDTSEGGKKIAYLRSALSNCLNTNITLPEVYLPSRKLSSSTSIIYLEDSKNFNNLDIQLGFEGCDSSSGTNNYLQTYFTLRVIKHNDTQDIYQPLFFHTFSETISPTTSNYSVFAFYTAVILVFGEYVRDFCSGEPEGVMLNEMPEPEKLVHLCQGVNIARNTNDFRMEKKLYYILIELLREPTYLREITKSSIEHFEECEANSKFITTDDLD